MLEPSQRGWFAEAGKAAECAIRLRDSAADAPVVWLGEVLPSLKLGSMLFQDRYKTSPCSGKSLDVFKCVQKSNGFLWETSKGDVDVEMESDIIKVLCGLIGLSSELDAPVAFTKGALTRSICSRLSQPLYDKQFLQMLDGEKSRGLMVFGCGTVLDMMADTVRAAKWDDYILRHISYAFPRHELEEIEQLQKELGLTMDEVFQEINAWEKHPLNRDNAVYPQAIREKLEKLVAGVPHFKFFELMHDSFTPRFDATDCPVPESHGGWQATVFRAAKVPAAAMSSKHENNVFDLGEEGDNGKGVLAYALSQVFDGYYEDLPLSVVKEDPPSGGVVSPEVWQLKGAHFLGTPETERSIVVKSIWLKQLADQSTVWKARGLYRDTQSFYIPALWAMSSNLRISLTSIDGGVRRRLRGTKWPVAFKRVPDGPFQRERSEEDLKKNGWYTAKIKAGIIYITLAAFKAFFKEGGVGLEIMPCVIAKATLVLLVQEYAEYVEAFLDEMTTESTGQHGTTKAKIMPALKMYILKELPTGEKIDQKALESSLEAHCISKVPHGTVERLYRISTKKYVKLNEE